MGFATTRNPAKAEALTAIGVDHVLLGDGNIADHVRAITPNGVDTALELVGTPTLPDTLRATRIHGVVCFTGMLSNQWTVRDFCPIDYIPYGVRLTAYAREATDLPPRILQGYFDDIEAGHALVPIDHVYRLEQIREAHTRMESGNATGKLIVVNSEPDNK